MHKQKGSLLIELAVVVAIVTLIAAGTVAWMAQQAEKTKAESLAVLMLSIQQSTQSLLDTHAFELLGSSEFSLEGVSNLQQPTLQELKQLGFLAPSFPLNEGIKLVLYKEGSCPGAQCHIHGLIYSTQPLLNKKQQIDMHAVAQWQSVAKGAGLVVQENKPTIFTGVHLVVEQQKLPAGLRFPAGSVALLASTDASVIARGGLSANENPNFQTDVDVQGTLNTANDLQVGRYLILPHTESLGSTCTTTGSVARGVDGKGLMSCEANRWVRPISAPATSIEAYKAMVQEVWRITLPEETPGGFYATTPNYYSTHCYIPNPLRRRCVCAGGYTARYYSDPGNSDTAQAVGRPRISIYGCR